ARSGAGCSPGEPVHTPRAAAAHATRTAAPRSLRSHSAANRRPLAAGGRAPPAHVPSRRRRETRRPRRRIRVPRHGQPSPRPRRRHRPRATRRRRVRASLPLRADATTPYLGERAEAPSDSAYDPSMLPDGVHHWTATHPEWEGPVSAYAIDDGTRV